jgi:hypothetical protein
MLAMRRMTWIGIGLTQLGGESDFFHAAMVRDILKSIYMLSSGGDRRPPRGGTSVQPSVRNLQPIEP